MSVVQAAAVSFFEGQSWALRGRVDANYFLDQERQHLESVTSLANDSHSRPSLLLPVLQTGGWALGVAAGLAPRKVYASPRWIISDG